MLQELKDMAVDKIPAFLNQVADTVTEGEYQRTLSEEQLTEQREFLTRDYLLLVQEEERIAGLKAESKALTDELKKQLKRSATAIKTRKVTETGTIYDVINVESGYKETYNEVGDLINSVKLRKNQLSILREASNG